MIDVPVCRSMLEKFLLKQGWSVFDRFDVWEGVLMTTARPPFGEGQVRYPKPSYMFHDRDPVQDLCRALDETAEALGIPREHVEEAVQRGYVQPLEGFSCTACGCCCLVVADARRSRFSPEEVALWERLSMRSVLRYVRRVDRPDYSFYEGWVHPASGRFLPRCPWAVAGPDGRGALCRIHEVKPLKCRSFPLYRDHARMFGCSGLDAAIATKGSGLSSQPGQDKTPACIPTTTSSSIRR